MHKAWPQMEALHKAGLAKSIGVSNFNVQSVWDLMSYAQVMPAVNEVELHPYNTQKELVRFLLAQGILPIGYCPIARGANSKKTPSLFEAPTIKTLMEKYGKTGSQILLNWNLTRNCAVIPKSSSFDRQKENFECFGFKLEEAEMAAIDELNEYKRICDFYPHTLGFSIFA
mmetsp:Transcript_37668/g.27763  ORF Transcript_37668/g.27763 Transcript_37668/m.27763 type:complete len:171 (+) Transcript_37668:413-925(+)